MPIVIQRQTELGEITTNTQEPSGFIVDNVTGEVKRSDSELLWNNGTRQLTIQPKAPATEFIVYVAGKKIVINSPLNVIITDTQGTWFFYINSSGALQATQTFFIDFIYSQGYVAFGYWDVTNSRFLFDEPFDERHGCKWDGHSHAAWHQTIGAQYRSGLALSGFTIGDGSLDVHAQFGSELGVIYDEDLRFGISAIVATNGLDILYHDASGKWFQTTNAGFSILTTGSGRLAYNPSGSGLVEVSNNNFALCHVFGTSGKDENGRLACFVGQEEYGNINDARSGAEEEINNLILAGLPTQEFRFIGTAIFQTSNGYVNAVKSRVRDTATSENYVDLRGYNFSPSGGSVSSHPNLSDLSFDSSGHGVGFNGFQRGTTNNITPPTINDDSSIGYRPGDFWLDTVADTPYVCLDASPASAIWMVMEHGTADIWSRTGTDVTLTNPGDTVTLEGDLVVDGSTATFIGLEDQNNTSVIDALILEHDTELVFPGSVGGGIGLRLKMANSESDPIDIARITSAWTDDTLSAENSDLKVYVMSNGSLTEVISFNAALGLIRTQNAHLSIKDDVRSTFTVENAILNAPSTALDIQHNVTGTPAVGIGTRLDIYTQSLAGSANISSRIESVLDVVTAANEESHLNFYIKDGGSLVDNFRVDKKGIHVNGDGPSTITSTSAPALIIQSDATNLGTNWIAPTAQPLGVLDQDALISIVSSEGGSVGSGITLDEVNSTTQAYVNNWNLNRNTSGFNSTLYLAYRTTPGSGGLVSMYFETDGRTYFPEAYGDTTASAANMTFGASGQLLRSTCGEYWKKDLRAFEPDTSGIYDVSIKTFKEKSSNVTGHSIIADANTFTNLPNAVIKADIVTEKDEDGNAIKTDKNVYDSLNWNFITTSMLVEMKKLRDRIAALE